MSTAKETDNFIHIECFEVLGDSDTVEGRGPLIHVAYFMTKPLAEEFVRSNRYKKFCAMGVLSESDVKYNVRPVALRIHKNMQDYDAYDKSKVINAIRGKLSDYEYAVLTAHIKANP